MKRSNMRSMTCRLAPAARRLQVPIAIMCLVMAAAAAATVFAGAIPTSRNSNFFAEAVATVTKGSNDRQSDSEFPPPVTGFGPFNGMVDVSITHSKLPGLTAFGDAQQNSTITLDAAGNLLSAQGSVSAHAEASQPDHLEPPQDPPVPPSVTNVRADATLASGMTLLFNVTRAGYEYAMTGSASAMASPDTVYADGRALGDLGLVSLSGGGTLFLERRSPEQGNSNLGSPTGPLPPGMYGFGVTASSEGHVANHRFLPRPVAAATATGTASATGQLTLMPPIFWIDAVNGDFGDGSRWSTGQRPAAGDNAVIDIPGNYAVTLDSNVTHKNLHLNGAGVNATLDVNGFDYVLDEISIGGVAGDSVSVTFDDSTLPVSVSAASATAVAGLPAGTAAATSPTARLRADLLKAGSGGDATVKIPITTTAGLIDGGGTVRVRTGNGRWDVQTLDVGQGGLILSTGGLVVSTGTVTLAPDAADVATVVIGQNGSALEAHQLRVGLKGNGSLNLADRGTLFSDNILLGDVAGSTGTIELRSGSAIVQDAVDNMIVGVGGGSRGFLDMTDSTFDTGALEIGFGGEGEVKVGSNSTLRVFGTTSSPLYVGVGSRGRLIIEGGGRVRRENSGKTTVGPLGEIDIRDGHLHENNELDVDGRLAVTAASGSASVGQNSIATPGKLTVGPGGLLTGVGIIFADVRVLSGGTPQFFGVVQPANSPGTLTIDGNYEQLGGRLDIEIAGTAPGQFDVLKVTGDVSLGGDLLLQFIDGFAPRQGDEFMFLDVDGALSGAFANIQLRGLRPGFQFDVRPDAAGLTMIALNDGVAVPEPASIALLIVVMLVTPSRRHAPHPLAVRPRAPFRLRP